MHISSAVVQRALQSQTAIVHDKFELNRFRLLNAHTSEFNIALPIRLRAHTAST
jgi:hypothetical protein